MSVLLDTSFLFAFKNLRDADHGRAVELFQEVFHGQHGAAHTTDFVFAEAVTVSLVRTGRHSAAVGIGDLILTGNRGSPTISLHYLSPEQLMDAWAEFRRHRDQRLSLTDWTSVVSARALELDAIVSFDHGFDGVFPRLF